jgi:CheY-specific phosphatase CheX
MIEEHWQRLRPMIVESTTSLLDTYGMPTECVEEQDCGVAPNEGLAASLGFTGDQMQGSLVICAPLTLLRHAFPNLRSSASLEDLRDWTGELANQLLGRVKRRVLVYGVEFYLSTPSVVTGRDLRSISGEGARRLAFACPAGTLYVEIQAHIAPGVRFVDLADVSPAMEGDVLLF